MPRILYTAVAAAALSSSFVNAAPMISPPPVSRRALLTANFPTSVPVARVEIKEVTLAARVAGGLHLHPCPVVGVITAGTIAFQLEGHPVEHLRVGDAFFEPANVRVARFDNEGDSPATFTACYLLGDGDHELIRLLPH